MAGTITALEIQKRNKERVNVYINGKYALAVTIAVAAGLRKGQQLSDAEIERLKEQDQRNKAYNHAIYFLGFRARSRAEMKDYLRGKKYPQTVVAEIIDRLAQEGYLDDTDFANTWVQERERFKPRGERALRYELRQKGVRDEAIEKALSQVDEDESAWRAIEGKLRQWRGLDEKTFTKKALGFLSRRGFGYQVARQAVERAWELLQDE